MTEALNRGWDELDSRSPLMLQLERAGVKIEVEPGRIKASLAADTSTAIDPAKR